MMIKNILFITIIFLLSTLGSTAQIFNKEYYLAFKTSEWKGYAAPTLYDIKIQQSPLSGSYLFYDKQGKPLSGRFHIIIHAQKYAVAEISKGLINGELRLYSYNQEIERYNLKNGVYEGKQYSFPSNETYTYDNGVLTHYISYHNNKQLKKELTYSNGKIQGDIIEYDSNGKIVEQKHYSNGLLSGETMEVSPQGYIKKATYVNGILHGDYIESYSNGNIAIKGAYENNDKTGLWISYESNGDIREESEYLEGKLHGAIKRYKKGALYELCEYAENKRHGKRQYYRGTPPKMRLSEEEHYADGELNGILKRFNERDILYFEAEYKDGEKIKSKEYHPTTGLIMLETLYRDRNSIAERVYNNKGVLKYLKLLDEQGYLVVVQEYNTKGQVTKNNSSYKKTATLKLVEDEWGIIDIP